MEQRLPTLNPGPFASATIPATLTILPSNLKGWHEVMTSKYLPQLLFCSSSIICHLSLVIGHWSLVIGYWLLVIGYWLLERISEPHSRLSLRERNATFAERKATIGDDIPGFEMRSGYWLSVTGH